MKWVTTLKTKTGKEPKEDGEKQAVKPSNCESMSRRPEENKVK